MFNLLSIGLSQSHDRGYEFDMLTQIDLDQFNMLSSQYFKKDVILNLFLVKLYCYQSFRLFFDSQSQPDYIRSTTAQFKFFSY